MNKIEIEIKQSGTGMYSPWHLAIAHELGVPLMCTADIGHFIKIGECIYKIIRPYGTKKLYDFFCDLEEKNDKGELSDEETLIILNDVIEGKDKDIVLEKCQPLDKFREQLLKMK
jgi:hypothetical protein